MSLLSITVAVSAQSKRDYVWLFGYNSNSYPQYPGVDGVVLDFNQVPVDITAREIALVLNWNYSGICDTNGNLLLYTNGCAVANGQHEIIENGNGLSPGAFFDEFCPDFGYPIPQGIIILPCPGNPNVFYIFHEEGTIISQVSDPGVKKLYLTRVDMSLSNGLGEVTNKNELIIEDSLNYGEVTAIKHANGADWWLIIPQFRNEKYYILLVTNEGVVSTIEQSIGFSTTSGGESGGQANFSPDGQFYFRSNPNDGTFIFDFDRNIGVLSNFRFIPSFGDAGFRGGVVASPNSKLLYVFTGLHAFQYDLLVENILESEILIAEFDGFQNPFSTLFYHGRIGPNCKIYVNSNTTVRNLHVIHYPNERGIACGFEQHAITLPHNNGRTLPNLPSNFNLDVGPPCDTSLIISSVFSPFPSPQMPEKLFRVFPNPASDYVMVEPETKKMIKDVRVVLTNALGAVVLQKQMERRPFLLDTEGILPGIYTLSVFSGATLLQSERVVIFD